MKSTDKKFYALDGATGAMQWEFATEGDLYSFAALSLNGIVYFGSWDHKVYALDGKTGAKLWEFETKAKVSCAPTIGTDGTVYIGSNDGRVYAFKTENNGLAKSPWPMRGQNPQHTGCRALKK